MTHRAEEFGPAPNHGSGGAPALARGLVDWALQHGSSLFGASAAEAFRALAGRLPFDPESYYAEVRLGRRRQVDLLFSLNAYTSPTVARAISLPGGLGASRDINGAWTRTRNLLADWTSSASPLREAISTLWLEFDDVTTSFENAAPSISACMVPGYDYRTRVEPVRDREDELSEALRVYQALSAHVDEHDVVTLERAIRALPNAGRCIHLSVMTARTPPALKLYLILPRSTLQTYLDDVGWSGTRELLAELLEGFASESLCGPDLYIDLNLWSLRHRQPALGVAFARQQASFDPQHERLLSRLVSVGHCNAEQASALANWQASAPSGESRWLDLKTAYREGELETKAYLGVARRQPPLARIFARPRATGSRNETESVLGVAGLPCRE